MNKMKGFKRRIKKTYGKKGIAFTKDVAGNIMNVKTVVGLFKQFNGGYKEQKYRTEIRKELDARDNCRTQFKETTEVVGMFTYGCLVVSGVIELNSERRKEIEDNVYPEIYAIQKDIDNGLLDFIFEMDEDDAPYKMFNLTITNRLLVAARLTPEEMEIFFSTREKLLGK